MTRIRSKYVEVLVRWRPHATRREERRLSRSLSGYPWLDVYRDGVQGELDKWATDDEVGGVMPIILRIIGARYVEGAIIPRGWGCVCEDCEALRACGDVNTVACPVEDGDMLPGVRIETSDTVRREALRPGVTSRS